MAIGQAISCGHRRSSDWEEPHPGLRLVLTDAPSCLGADDLSVDPCDSGCGDGDSVIESWTAGVSRSDTAAKGVGQLSQSRRPSPSRSWLSRRRIRMKIRDAAHSPNKSPAIATTATSAMTADEFLTRPMTSGQQSIDTSVDMDVDSDPETDMESVSACRSIETPSATTAATEDVWTAAPRRMAMSASTLAVTDRSGRLGGEDDTASTVVDSDAISYATTADCDVYGWEAELDRKRSMSVVSASFVGSSIGDDADSASRLNELRDYQFRRADGRRRSFLHRVFNNGEETDKTASDGGRGRGTPTSVPPVPAIPPSFLNFAVRNSNRL
ncbi:hypothetical protein CMQ_4328 [Grosmannia clavigera kw1407]|uniref:Uncharacterized protein n=1 Tax=Grosmannia clavigera (strain kw1407 / UAMH 11150) TaxID=655863 RepID=F0XTE4_GROCL|nr:uncharacterized protein CMQ_4328 [Grosmannia clavigera kw1407]EFW98476.1 hypothetical protein CMQ_4328 [Grosmannia clavigera kw1407]